MSPLKAIREKCIDCCCGQLKEVRLCPVVNCPLHGFRFGHKPAGISLVSEDEGDEE